jgi:hypothetical protein
MAGVFFPAFVPTSANNKTLQTHCLQGHGRLLKSNPLAVPACESHISMHWIVWSILVVVAHPFVRPIHTWLNSELVAIMEK